VETITRSSQCRDREKALARGPSVAATSGGRQNLVSPDSLPETDGQEETEVHEIVRRFLNLLLKLH